MAKNLEMRTEDYHSKEIVMQNKTELEGVFDNLDNDKKDEFNFSQIDFNTRLTGDEIKSIMIFDEIKQMGLLPQEAQLSRHKKRLSVSLNGQGREEKVRIVQGERENRGGGSIMEKMGNLFRRKD